MFKQRVVTAQVPQRVVTAQVPQQYDQKRNEQHSRLDTRDIDIVGGEGLRERSEDRNCLDFFGDFFRRPPIKMMAEREMSNSSILGSATSTDSTASTAATEGVEGPDSLGDIYADNLENQEVSLEDLDQTVWEYIKRIMAIKVDNSSNFSDIFKNGISSKDVSNALEDVEKIINKILELSNQIIECDKDYKTGEVIIRSLDQKILPISRYTSHEHIVRGYSDQKKIAQKELLKIKEEKKEFLDTMKEEVKSFREISLDDASKFGEYALSYIDTLTVYFFDLKNKLNQIKKTGTSFNDGLDQMEMLHVELVEILKEKYEHVKVQVASLYEKEKIEYDSMLAKQVPETVLLRSSEALLKRNASCPNF